LLQFYSQLEGQGDASEAMKSGGGGLSLGVSVSVMANDEEILEDKMKTIFDWCKEGSTDRVAKLLQKKNVVDTKDSEVMRS